MSRFDSDQSAKDGLWSDPTVDASAIVANLEAISTDRLDEMQILLTFDLAEHDVTGLQDRVVADRLDDAKLTRLDFALHRVSARSKRNGVPVFQARNMATGPTQARLIEAQASNEQRRDHGSQAGPDHRNPGIGPVARAFAGDGQQAVGDAGAQVAGRVQGVAGRSAQR